MKKDKEIREEFLKKWGGNDKKDTSHIVADEIADYFLKLRHSDRLELLEYVKGKKMGYYSPKNETGLPLSAISPERLGAMAYNGCIDDITSHLEGLEHE